MRAIGPALADYIDNCAPAQLHNTHREMINIGILRNGTSRVDTIAKAIANIDHPKKYSQALGTFCTAGAPNLIPPRYSPGDGLGGSLLELHTPEPL